MTKDISIKQLHKDQRNFNLGTEEGTKLMDKSFSELGCGRSILVDKDNNIIAGNKSRDAAMRNGVKKVQVIDSDGTELIAVKRIDVSIDSEEGRKLALADNVTQEKNLAWNKAEIASIADEIDDFNVGDWGVDLDIADEPSGGGNINITENHYEQSGENEVVPPFRLFFAKEQAEVIKEALKAAKRKEEYKTIDAFDNENTNAKALTLIVKQWIERRK